MITLVVTSCGRFDLLQRTLASFFAFADMPVSAAVITEDSGELIPAAALNEIPRTIPRQIKITAHRVGQIDSIDRAYELVRTPFVFHLEDDWEFYRTGFMQESYDALLTHPECINLWLRERNDTNGHPIDGDVLRFGYNRRWHGFTFNPTLKRMADYHRVVRYGHIARFDPRDPGSAEAAIGGWYHRNGFHARIAASGYVKHIGEGRHVRH